MSKPISRFYNGSTAFYLKNEKCKRNKQKKRKESKQSKALA